MRHRAVLRVTTWPACLDSSWVRPRARSRGISCSRQRWFAPSDTTLSTCLTQAQVDNAFVNWLANFAAAGGCLSTNTDLTTLAAPPFCGGALTVTFDANDACGQAASCAATFTLPDAPILSVNCPANIATLLCASQQDIITAWNNWIAQFSFAGGCLVDTTDLTTFSPPDSCGGAVTIDFTATDACGQSASCAATFTVPTPTPVTVACPGDQQPSVSTPRHLELRSWNA